MTRLRQAAAFLLLVSCAIAHGEVVDLQAAPGALSRPVVDFCWRRKTSEFDPGTLRIYLRNTRAQNLTVKRVLVDGEAIPTWGADWDRQNKNPDPPEVQTREPDDFVLKSIVIRPPLRRVLWARLAPAVIPPGAIAEFSAKLFIPTVKPITVELVPEAGEAIKVVVASVTPAVAITAITFSPKYDRIYAYLEGRDDEAAEVDQFELNGQPVSKGLWLPAQRLGKGDKLPAVLSLDTPLKQGDFITLKVLFQGGIVAEERVRVRRRGRERGRGHARALTAITPVSDVAIAGAGLYWRAPWSNTRLSGAPACACDSLSVGRRA